MRVSTAISRLTQNHTVITLCDVDFHTAAVVPYVNTNKSGNWFIVGVFDKCAFHLGSFLKKVSGQRVEQFPRQWNSVRVSNVYICFMWMSYRSNYVLLLRLNV